MEVDKEKVEQKIKQLEMRRNMMTGDLQQSQLKVQQLPMNLALIQGEINGLRSVMEAEGEEKEKPKIEKVTKTKDVETEAKDNKEKKP